MIPKLSPRSFVIAFAILMLLPMVAAGEELVPAGSIWRYLDNGTNQGTAWRATSFNDAAWATGAAELGYGDGDEDTIVSYGPNANNKYVTTYFRRAFNVTNPNAYTSLVLSTLRDDGAVVYLNGVEVWRSNNMPAGAIGYQTYASWSLGTPEEAAFTDVQLAASLLVAGQNVLAVEVHQADATSTDVSFDLRLEGLTSYVVTRGPYLQMGTPTSMIVRWRTNGATNSRVRYGTTPEALNVMVDAAALTTEHQIALTGLTPSTTYYYSVGSSTQTLSGDATHTFVTPPPASTAIPTRVWILGDSGAANTFAMAVRDAYLSYPDSAQTNLWLMLGDNAYEDGTDAEYQAAVFDMYPTMLRRSVLWPTLGNHDTAHLTTAPPTLPYFAMFSLPTAGEAGGVASGTEKYYSFDYGNIHFVCLDSMTSDRSPTGPMLTWLESDLASTTEQWIIAFWHHPPYSKGSHDSDWETPLIEMRTNALPILEDYGVDLVLSGHSHSYERSYLIDSHYGMSNTFISSMKKDGGSGRPEDTGAYSKPTLGIAPHEGAVYAVAGSSSIISGGAFNHPAMFISLNNYGSMVLDVNGGRLDAKFLRENGAIADSFTIIKGPPATAPSAPSALSAAAISPTAIDLTWTDNSTNEDRFTIERCSGSPAVCSEIAQPAANATSYSDSGLTPNTAYSYRVRAENTYGNSAYSNTATATTQSCVYTVTPTSFDFPASGGAGEATITTSAGCAWSSSEDVEWITLTGGTSGTGSGATTFTIAANDGAARNASITVAGTVIPVTQDAAACDYDVSPSSFTIPAGGGTGEVTITTTGWCAWESSSNDAWITLNGGTSGTGSGTTTFTVAANDGAQRNGSITVAGTVIPITQDAAACDYDVSPASFAVPAAGGAREVTITTTSWCTWQSSSNDAWITLNTGTSGTGSGMTTFTVAANDGAARNGSITVAGIVIPITQEAAACVYDVSPASFTVPAGGGAREVTITPTGWCAWQSSSNDAWITLNSGTSGTGSGTTTFTVAANPGAQRNGSITVAGTVIPITQDAAACTYEVSPASFAVPVAGGAREVTITTTSWCAWQSSSNDVWITLNGGASGTGSGTTTFTVAANDGAARNGSITVAGTIIPITQDAAACDYAVSPASFTVPAAGGAREVTITTTSWCAWQSSSNDAWITLNGGASGTGSGTTTFTVAANDGAERNGSIIVAGTVIPITQEAAACAYGVSPASFTVPAGGGAREVTITTTGWCAAWQSSSNDAWITLNSGTSGTGSGTTTFTVAANPGAQRNGSITVAGTVIPITQDAAACTYEVSPTSFTVPAGGGTREVSISTGSWCAWQSSSNVAWITLTNGLSGTGNGTTTFTITANEGGERSASITVAGTVIPITQAAAACTYDVSPTSFSVTSAGGSREVTITTGSWCPWQSSSSVAWITLTGGLSGTGSGVTTFTIAANSGAQRNGSITVAGTVIQISQDAPAPPAPPAGVSAQAISNSTIRVTWNTVANATGYEILRASSGSAFVPINMSATTLFDDTTVTPGAAYRYAVRAVNSSGVSAPSASDLATARIFTDGSLPPGTRVKAVHITERRSAVNAVRALAGLAPYAFNGSSVIRATHINELRTALDQALAILGYATGGYTDVVSAGTLIRAVHFREIVERVQ